MVFEKEKKGHISKLEKIYCSQKSWTRFEGQPVVTLEAAALGKAVIVSDIPELKYTVGNKFGISFKKEDWRDLSTKIEYLWQNKEMIKKWEKMAKNLLKLHLG